MKAGIPAINYFIKTFNHNMNLGVSVIIPAYNAGATIAKTIGSLLSQTFTAWEAIIVNDGSTDDTAAIVITYINREPRLRLVNQPNEGLAGARNTGIQHARFNWLLFLDADDWISNLFLERMMAKLEVNTELDAVHCGWSTVSPDGTVMDKKYALDETDMFPSFVRTCAFVVHSCIIRKSIAVTVGGFDTGFKTCEDWDFWQRICRIGARFGAIKEAHAYYRMRLDSLSKKVKESLVNALKLIDQGHSFDARVLNPVSIYINGLEADKINTEKLYCTTWYAGMQIGKGEDARPMFDLLSHEIYEKLNADVVADYIFEAVCFCTCKLPAEWIGLWNKNHLHVKEYLITLEQFSPTKNLAANTLIAMERLVLKHATIMGPLLFETTYAVNVELTGAIVTLQPPAKAQRLIIKVHMEGLYLGMIELPATGIPLEGQLIKHHIALRFAWQILKRFFEYTVYSNELGATENEEQYAALSEKLHNEIGWREFLRQLWGKYNWTAENFYNPQLPVIHIDKIVDRPCLTSIEISEPLLDVTVKAKYAFIEITVGRTHFGYIKLPVINKKISENAILAGVNTAGGFDLCIACVREALIGATLNKPVSLRNRLRENALLKEQDINCLKLF